MAKKRKLIDIDTELLVVAKKEAADQGMATKKFIELIIENYLKKSIYLQKKIIE